ncbi:hypothetical protein C1646_672559 [Rhizophagus diaphanus]|nr:hypothetical protein C1646_672559 [Rhizophagus diaphanus] [Rhizophagus sp. MUCL 43196]
MSVATEGLEEIQSKVTRETKQASLINQVLTYIEESLKKLTPEEKQDVVTIDLSAYKLDNVVVRETIHDSYNAEIIGEHMFIKYDSKKKEKIHRRLANSAEAHNQNWDVDVNGMCTDNNRNEFLPDVGVWFQMPTQAQRTRPIAEQCPLPDVWVEVFYYRDPDRSRALTNIAFVQQQNLGIEFIGIALPYSTNTFQQNPNPGIDTTPANPLANQNARPFIAPYIIHWDVNNVPVYYRINWNEHLVLRCGWVLEFNIVLNVLAM